MQLLFQNIIDIFAQVHCIVLFLLHNYQLISRLELNNNKLGFISNIDHEHCQFLSDVSVHPTLLFQDASVAKKGKKSSMGSLGCFKTISPHS